MLYSVPIKWIGIRPSHVADLEDKLPNNVFLEADGSGLQAY